MALQCTVRMGGADWLGLLQSGRKFLALPRALFLHPILPTSLLHSLDDLQLASEMLQFTDLHSRDNTGVCSIFYSGRNAPSVTGDGCSQSQPKTYFLTKFISTTACLHLLMKPFCGKNNRRTKAVSPSTHRPFVQTDRSRPFGLSKWAFSPFLVPPPTFLCLEPMFAPRA